MGWGKYYFSMKTNDILSRFHEGKKARSLSVIFKAALNTLINFFCYHMKLLLRLEWLGTFRYL